MEQNKNDKQKSLILNILLGAVILLIVIFAGNYFFVRVAYTYTDDASVQQNLVPVNCKVGGYIEKVSFSEFSEVKKGDTLLVIDPTDYLIRLSQAESGLENALANKNVMEANVLTLNNAQKIAEANLKETEARLWNAEQNYNRYEKLVGEKSATLQQFDQIKTEYESLKARKYAMVKALEGARLSTNEAKSRLKAMEAAVKAAEVGVKAAEQDLLYCVILAPCNGITGRKTVNEGQLMQRGQSLVQIIENDEKWVTANFLEKQSEHITVGKEVKIEIDAYPGAEFNGVIESVAGATGSVFSLIPTDNATGNFVKVQQRIPVKIALNNSILSKELRAGMNAVVYVK